jgi:hypothetical protein
LVLKLHHLSFGKLKMAEDDIARLLQNVDFEEILPDERNTDGINVDKSTKCSQIWPAIKVQGMNDKSQI